MIRCKIKNLGLQTLVLLIFCFTCFTINAQTITVAGNNWTVPITSITEAGMDYTGNYESNANLITISGSLPGSFLNLLSGGVAAVISVQYIPSSWNNSLHLYTRRSGGSASIGGFCILCTASVNNGTNYIEIPQSINTQFFTINFTGTLGIGNSISYSGINVQLRINGVSVTVPANNYSATLVFTVGAP